ncbi:phosphatase 2C-like domain-containing protein [Polychytrium aggregatum]|uniref:phosphatase 2C-like domain-containing protein n=1 Tax=Polychytrium aggregatum TaxID=110093 RepID=UPI0022FEC690|nr:phosphatase 2C-like domain-containing protein [Polychytrium aggregatum]KAI9205726.1 phosphatase 2C-like domain-containing protein [Polychytrium aggregatum]
MALGLGRPLAAAVCRMQPCGYPILRRVCGQIQPIYRPQIGQPWLRLLTSATKPSVFDMFEKRFNPTTELTYQFSIGAAAMPKNPRLKVLKTGLFSSSQAGEDSFFSRHDAIGVADGVGGWTQVKGANPALFSRKLMHYANMEIAKFDDIANAEYSIEEYVDLDPKNVLTESYKRICEDAAKELLVGSSTALIVVLRSNELRVTSIGDCGLLIIRQNEAIFRTEEQQHSFNFPFQLGTGSTDLPSDAQSYHVHVREGDIVVVGSDGVFDNLTDEEIVEIVKAEQIISTHTIEATAFQITPDGGEFVPEDSDSDDTAVPKTESVVIETVTSSHDVSPTVRTIQTVKVDPSLIATKILKRAREIAEDSRHVGNPFQTRAMEEGLYYRGGKMDDITVVVGVISLSEDSPDRR